LNRHQKEQAVGELAYEFGAAEAVYAVDYRGLTVAQISELRARLLQNETTLKVVKNSVTKLAADKAEVSTINGELSGPTALAFVRGDAAASAKILQGFVKESNDILELKGGLLNGKPLTSADVVSIAKLPSRETLIQQLVTLIASPISGTARTLNAILAAVPVQLQKIADEGLIGAGAPAAAAPAASETPEAAAPADADETTEAEAPAADADGDAASSDDAPTDSTEE
jgi:large subunit ribosomal protein L10